MSKLKVIFKYSLKGEIKESIEMLLSPQKYQHLRSVVWPNLILLIRYFFKQKEILKQAEQWWEPYKDKVEDIFLKLNLKIDNKVICYVTSIGSEGMFSVEDKAICARHFKSGGPKEFVETVVHELLHLATYKTTLTYEEREDIVENYLKNPLLTEALQSSD